MYFINVFLYIGAFFWGLLVLWHIAGFLWHIAGGHNEIGKDEIVQIEIVTKNGDIFTEDFDDAEEANKTFLQAFNDINLQDEMVFVRIQDSIVVKNDIVNISLVRN